jgi:hypothetical protein
MDAPTDTGTLESVIAATPAGGSTMGAPSKTLSFFLPAVAVPAPADDFADVEPPPIAVSWSREKPSDLTVPQLRQSIASLRKQIADAGAVNEREMDAVGDLTQRLSDAYERVRQLELSREANAASAETGCFFSR